MLNRLLLSLSALALVGGLYAHDPEGEKPAEVPVVETEGDGAEGAAKDEQAKGDKPEQAAKGDKGDKAMGAEKKAEKAKGAEHAADQAKDKAAETSAVKQ